MGKQIDQESDTETRQHGVNQIGVGVEGHLQPPARVVNFGVHRHGLHEGRQDEGEMEEVDPDPFFQRKAENKKNGGEVADGGKGGEGPAQLQPEESGPELELLQGG